MIKYLKYFLPLFIFQLSLASFSSVGSIPIEHYEAIVIGKMISQKVKKINNYYVTEYKLKPEEWLFKKTAIKKTKYIKIKILGADLPKKGIIIKSSVSPEYVPMNKEAIFFLEKTIKKEKKIFTISKGGIIMDLNMKTEILKKELEL